MTKIISYLVILFLLACTNSNKTKGGNKPQDNISIDKKTIINNSNEKGNEETFDDFFAKFSSDSLFQISRIKFPLHKIIADVTGETEEIKVLKKDWKFIDFKDNISSVEGYVYTKVKMDDTHIKYEMQGIDNGISIEYIFHKENNLWHLIEIQDMST